MTDSGMIIGTVGFLGAGKMATALASGFLNELISADDLIASDPYEASRSAFRTATGAEVTDDNRDVVTKASIVILAVKPHILPELIAEVRDLLTPDHLVISIAAGITLDLLEGGLGPDIRVLRVMPNTPCLVGQGACGIAAGTCATGEDIALVESMLQTVGEVARVPESLLDSITGLSGSGPAYIYQVIEALSDGGVLMGLPRPIATRFAAQTVAGAAAMVLETGLHPGELKDAVTSPGGTTIAGLEALESLGLRSALISAVRAATERSQELGQVED